MADNWQCQNCQAQNPPRKRKCWQCGQLRAPKALQQSQPSAPTPTASAQPPRYEPTSPSSQPADNRWKFSLALNRRLPSINMTNRTVSIGTVGLVMLTCLAACCVLPFIPRTMTPAQSVAATQTPITRQVAAAIGSTEPQAEPTATIAPLPSATNTARPTTTKRPTDSPTATIRPTDTPAATATFAADLALVVGIVDGDTIDVQLADGSTARLRYIGIDTPESGATCGTQATAANRALVEGKQVLLEKDRSETDIYGRLLRYVYVGDVFVNAELVRLGYAESKRYPPDTAKANELDALEVQARAQNQNCYAMGAFTPPTAVIAATQPPATNPQPTQPVVIGGYVCANGQACIKGNINSEGEKIYHFPGCQSYDRTVIDESAGERWFVTAAEAEAAGWRQARNC